MGWMFVKKKPGEANGPERVGLGAFTFPGGGDQRVRQLVLEDFGQSVQVLEGRGGALP